MPADRELTDLQLTILSALWHRPDLTVTEVYDAIGDRIPTTRQTVNTLLWRLERRKLVSRRVRDGKTVYRAVGNRRRVLAERLTTLLGVLFDSGGAAAPSALRAGDVSPGDAERLRDLLRRAESDLGLQQTSRRRK